MLEFVPKKTYDAATKRWKWRVNFFRRRTIPDGAAVHESAFQRDPSYRKRCRNFPTNPVMIATNCPASLDL